MSNSLRMKLAVASLLLLGTINSPLTGSGNCQQCHVPATGDASCVPADGTKWDTNTDCTVDGDHCVFNGYRC